MPILFSQAIMNGKNITSPPKKAITGSPTKDKNFGSGAKSYKPSIIQTPTKGRYTPEQSPNPIGNHTSKMKAAMDKITPSKEHQRVGTEAKNRLSSQQQKY